MTELYTVDNGLFYVVDFFDGVQIVPDKWVITDETLAYWPKTKSDKDYDTLVYNRSSVKDNWTLEPIKTILYKTGIQKSLIPDCVFLMFLFSFILIYSHFLTFVYVLFYLSK